MTKKTTLVEALRQAKFPTEAPLVEEKKTTSSVSAPSRQGKKGITGFFDPSVSRQMRQLALDQNKTIQGLLQEALNDLFSKYGKPPIA